MASRITDTHIKYSQERMYCLGRLKWAMNGKSLKELFSD